MDIVKLAGLERWAVPNKSYPGLPKELEPYYVYLSDSGHSIVVVLENTYHGGDPVQHLCPASVKTVLRNGYRIEDGLVWCRIPYDEELGLLTPHEDYEF